MSIRPMLPHNKSPLSPVLERKGGFDWLTASSCRKGTVWSMVCDRPWVAATGLRTTPAATVSIALALAVLTALGSRAKFRSILLALGVYTTAAK